jgi:hypothetical protein
VKVASQNLGLERPSVTFEDHSRARLESLTGVHERRPGVWSPGRAQQQALGSATSREAPADQPRWKDASVVDDDQIARLEERRQIGKRVMRDATRRPAQAQETRSTSFSRRLLRDEIGGEIEVELGDAHL